jgi:hypothetical protein
MYINPFLAGVLCTVFFEVVAIVLYGMIFGRRYDDEDQEDQRDENK